MDGFDCDEAEAQLMLALEELALRQTRDAEYESQVDALERKKSRLQMRLEAAKREVQQLRSEASRQESVALRELDRETSSLTQEVSKTRDEIRALEQQHSEFESKCGELERQKGDLQKAASVLEKQVEELKSLDTELAKKGFKLRKMLQELRFQVSHLEQEQRELVEATRQATLKGEALLVEKQQRASRIRRLETDNDALRLALVEARARSHCGCRRDGSAGDAALLRREDTSAEQRHQQLMDDIVKTRAEYAALLSRVVYKETESVRVQTEEGHEEL